MIEKNPIYYWTACGCKLFKEDTKKFYNKRICKEHGKPVVKRTKKCVDGPEEFTIDQRGCGGLRCEYHLEIQKAKIREKAWKKKNAKKMVERAIAKKKKAINCKNEVGKKSHHAPTKFRRDFRGDYCRKLIGCMTVAACGDCLEYSGIFPWHDPAKLPHFTL